MKLFRPFGVALVAVFAFSAMVAATASAESLPTLLAEWLVNNTGVTATLPVDFEAQELLWETKTVLGNVDVLCSGLFDGTIGEDGVGELAEMLSLNGELISLTALTGLALECVSDTTSLCSNPAKLWMVNLPWPTLLELLVDGTEEFLVYLIMMKGASNPGWEVECANGLSDECTALEFVSKMTNLAGGVDTMFEEAFTVLAGAELFNCVTAGANTGVLEGLVEMLTTEAGTTLQVSSL